MKDDEVVWQGFGEFNESDVHHQYGIVLRTPPYTRPVAEPVVSVYVQLYRPSDGSTSEPLEFRYKSNLNRAGIKRPRNDSKDYIPTVVGSHESSSQSPSPLVGPRQSHGNSHSYGSKSNSSQNYDSEVSLFDNEPLPSYMASFTASDMSFSSNDFKGLFNHEDLCRWLDREIHVTDHRLEIDAVGSSTATSVQRSPNELNCSLLDKLKMIIKLFKNNFDDAKLGEMMMVLVAAQSATAENILLDAIVNGEIEEVKDLILILIKYNMIEVFKSVNDIDQNCLHLSILAGYQSLLKVFLSLGVDANKADAFGQTPLHTAVVQDSHDLVNDFLQASSHVKLDELNDDGFSPLHIAIMNDNFEIVKLLIAAGADVLKVSPPSGNNALHFALSGQRFNLELINYLIACDEQLLTIDNNSMMNALELACHNRLPETLIQHLSNFYDESYNLACPRDDNDESDSDSDNEIVLEKKKIIFDEVCMRELCDIFDRDQKWRSLVVIMDLESKSEEWAQAASPSRCLFAHLEVSTGTLKSTSALNDKILFQSIQKPLSSILEFFDMLDETQAVNVIDAMLAREFDK